MYIEKYLELVHVAEMHLQACASSPYELVLNILRYTYYNLKLFRIYATLAQCCKNTQNIHICMIMGQH